VRIARLPVRSNNPPVRYACPVTACIEDIFKSHYMSNAEDYMTRASEEEDDEDFDDEGGSSSRTATSPSCRVSADIKETAQAVLPTLFLTSSVWKTTGSGHSSRD